MRISFLSVCALALIGFTASGCDAVQDGIGSGAPIASNSCYTLSSVSYGADPDGVLLTWTDNCTTATVRVERRLNYGSWMLAGNAPANSGSFLDPSYLIGDPTESPAQYRIRYNSVPTPDWVYSGEFKVRHNDA